MYEDVVLRVSHHFFCHVSVSDTALCYCHVLSCDRQVVDRVFQSVLDRAEVTSGGRYAVDCSSDLVDRSLCALQCADAYTSAIPKDFALMLLSRSRWW